jgi:hypothetical protein
VRAKNRDPMWGLFVEGVTIFFLIKLDFRKLNSGENLSAKFMIFVIKRSGDFS